MRVRHTDIDDVLIKLSNRRFDGPKKRVAYSLPPSVADLLRICAAIDNRSINQTLEMAILAYSERFLGDTTNSLTSPPPPKIPSPSRARTRVYKTDNFYTLHPDGTITEDKPTQQPPPTIT